MKKDNRVYLGNTFYGNTFFVDNQHFALIKDIKMAMRCKAHCWCVVGLVEQKGNKKLGGKQTVCCNNSYAFANVAM
jgi:hypothetical protein